MTRFLASGTIFCEDNACRGTKLFDGTKLSKCNKCYKRELAQCCGTICLEARNLSRRKDLIVSRYALCPPKRSECGYPGSRTIANLSRVQELSKNRDNLSRSAGSLLNIPSVFIARFLFNFSDNEWYLQCHGIISARIEEPHFL